MGSNLKKVGSCWEIFYFFFNKKRIQILVGWFKTLWQYGMGAIPVSICSFSAAASAHYAWENYFKIISDNPSQMGFISSKPSVSGFLGVCVSLTATNGRLPRGKMLRGVGGRGKKSPDLAEPPRAADVDCNNLLFRFSIIWPPFLQRLINADILWTLL